MSRRMIDPQVIIKSQIVDDGYGVVLSELLEKYGTILPPETGYEKAITLQIYSRFSDIDEEWAIADDSGSKAFILPNTTITMSKHQNYNNGIIITGALVGNLNDMNLMNFVQILGGAYENGIHLYTNYEVDVHIIRV